MRIVGGLISGLLLGLGLALLLFSYAKIAFGTNAFPLVIVLGVVIGLLLGILGTMVKRRGDPADAAAPAEA